MVDFYGRITLERVGTINIYCSPNIFNCSHCRICRLSEQNVITEINTTTYNRLHLCTEMDRGSEPKTSRSLRKEKYTSPKFQHEWLVSSSGIGTCATVDWAKRPLEGELLETVHPYQLVA
jgi:hypothetical protein